jgi:hypothetical protein
MNKLMTWFDYVYYRICFAYEKRREPDPWVHATSILTLSQGFNVLFIIAIIDEFVSFNIIKGGKFAFLIFMLTLWQLNFWRHKKISYTILKNRWKDEPKKRRRKRGWLVFLYTIMSFLSIVGYGFIKHNIIGGKSFFIH